MNHRIFERTLRPLVFQRACLFERHFNPQGRAICALKDLAIVASFLEVLQVVNIGKLPALPPPPTVSSFLLWGRIFPMTSTLQAIVTEATVMNCFWVPSHQHLRSPKPPLPFILSFRCYQHLRSPKPHLPLILSFRRYQHLKSPTPPLPFILSFCSCRHISPSPRNHLIIPSHHMWSNLAKMACSLAYGRSENAQGCGILTSCPLQPFHSTVFVGLKPKHSCHSSERQDVW